MQTQTDRRFLRIAETDERHARCYRRDRASIARMRGQVPRADLTASHCIADFSMSLIGMAAAAATRV